MAPVSHKAVPHQLTRNRSYHVQFLKLFTNCRRDSTKNFSGIWKYRPSKVIPKKYFFAYLKTSTARNLPFLILQSFFFRRSYSEAASDSFLNSLQAYSSGNATSAGSICHRQQLLRNHSSVEWTDPHKTLTSLLLVIIILDFCLGSLLQTQCPSRQFIYNYLQDLNASNFFPIQKNELTGHPVLD